MKDLIGQVKAGDEDAFRQLIGPYQGELRLHCYRILGSAQDAEDALQETLLAAWRGLAQFEGRSSVRTWLYRVATSCCLKALRSASRRPLSQCVKPRTDFSASSRGMPRSFATANASPNSFGSIHRLTMIPMSCRRPARYAFPGSG